MNYSKKMEVINRSVPEIQSELATFFLMNNFKVEVQDDNGMRVENLYPRFDLKRPPAAEIHRAEFSLTRQKDHVLVEVRADLLKVHKIFKRRKRMTYTVMAALIIIDLLYTSGAFFMPELGSRMIVDIVLILSFIPLIYLILHYHFFKIYNNKHHNDLDRLLENLQYK